MCSPEVIYRRVLPTTLIKPVDFQLVEVAEVGRLAKFNVLAVLWYNGWLPFHRVGIPEHTVHELHYSKQITHCTFGDLVRTITYIPKCMMEL